MKVVSEVPGNHAFRPQADAIRGGRLGIIWKSAREQNLVASQANPSPPIFLFNRKNMARNKDPNSRTCRRDWWQLYGLAVRIDEGGIHVLKAGFDKAA